MIIETVTYRCRNCHSENIVKNGRNACGKQRYRYRCWDCRACKVLEPTLRYSEVRKEEILMSYQERPCLRGIVRILGVSRPTLSDWLKKLRYLPEVKTGLADARPDDILELKSVVTSTSGATRYVWTGTAL